MTANATVVAKVYNIDGDTEVVASGGTLKVESGGIVNFETGTIVKANGTQANHIADPTGGTTADAESRTAIAAILVALENLGILKTS